MHVGRHTILVYVSPDRSSQYIQCRKSAKNCSLSVHLKLKDTTIQRSVLDVCAKTMMMTFCVADPAKFFPIPTFNLEPKNCICVIFLPDLKIQ